MRLALDRASDRVAWAPPLLRRAGVAVRVVEAPPLPAGAEAAAEAYIARLGRRLEQWVRIPASTQRHWRAAEGEGLPRLAAFFSSVGARPDARVLALRRTLLRRLGDHRRDLLAVWADEAALAVLAPEDRPHWRGRAEAVAARLEAGELTLEEVELTLLLGALKAQSWPALWCPWYRRYSAVEVSVELPALTARLLGLAAEEGAWAARS